MKDKNEDRILIEKLEYEKLLEAQKILCCSEAAGVDCWEGYEYALENIED